MLKQYDNVITDFEDEISYTDNKDSTNSRLEKNLAILGIDNTGIDRFRDVQEGDLIALKVGFNIIALGKFKNRISITTWETLLKRIYPEEKDLEKFSEQYWFELESKIDIIIPERSD